MKSIIVILFSLLLLSGCKTKPLTKEIKKEFTNCFDAKNTDIRSLINIDGYYVLQYLKGDLHEPVSSYRDTVSVNMIFYEDGTLVYNFFSCFDYPEDIPSYLQKVNENSKDTIMDDSKVNHFYSGFYWGIYRIDGDTIKAQYINHTSGMTPWDAREKWFKFINRNTIEVILSKPVGNSLTEYQEKLWDEFPLKCFPVKFYPLEVIPPPNCWLKEREWFWCKNRTLPNSGLQPE